MDGHRDNATLLSSERSTEVSNILITSGPWRVRELELSPGKAESLWEELKKYRTLFSDFTRNHRELFFNLLQDPFSFWLEVLAEDDSTLGIMYVTGLDQLTDASLHLMFFDRKPTEKSELVKEMIELIFERFPSLNRLSASLPDIYHATIRLAKRSGMVEEGIRRKSTLIGGQLRDEIMLGILAEEALSGRNS